MVVMSEKGGSCVISKDIQAAALPSDLPISRLPLAAASSRE